MLITVTELPEYIRRANELLNEAERKAIIDYLAAHPRSGDIMEGTGGIRKLAGHVATKVKAVESESFISTMTNVFRSICLPFLEKMNKRTSQNLNARNSPSWFQYSFKSL